MLSIGGGGKGCHRAGRIQTVAFFKSTESLFHLALQRCLVNMLTCMALSNAAARTFVRIGGKENLHFCMGKDDGANIATLGNNILSIGTFALEHHHGLANTGIGRNFRNACVHLRRADLRAYIVSINHDAG